MSTSAATARITGIDYQPADRGGLRAEQLGELTVILGANATGKSVLARRLAGEPTGADDLRLQVTGAWPGPPVLLTFDELLRPGLDLASFARRPGARPAGDRPGSEAARIDQVLAAFAAAPLSRPGEHPGAPVPHPAHRAPPAEDRAGARAEALASVDVEIDALRIALRDDADVPETATLQRSLSLLRGLANWPAPAVDPGRPTDPAGVPPSPLSAPSPLAQPQPAVQLRLEARSEPRQPDPAALAGVLDWARRVHPSLLAVMALLVVLALALMVGGQSALAVPVSFVAVCAALLALLAPPTAQAAAAVPLGFGSLSRLLVSDAEPAGATGPAALLDAPPSPGVAPSLPDPRSVSLALLALPADAGQAELDRCRVDLEAQLAERRRLDRLRLELGQRLEQRRALLSAEDSSPKATSADEDWQDLLDARRAMVLEVVRHRRAERQRADAERRDAIVAELTRLRQGLAGGPDDRRAERIDARFARATAGRWQHLRAADADDDQHRETVAVAADGQVRPLARLARADRQLAALAVGLTAAELDEPGRPIVLDDALLGLDDPTLRAVAAQLAGLADVHQLFVFTSSSTVATALCEAHPRARLLQLS